MIWWLDLLTHIKRIFTDHFDFFPHSSYILLKNRFIKISKILGAAFWGMLSSLWVRLDDSPVIRKRNEQMTLSQKKYFANFVKSGASYKSFAFEYLRIFKKSTSRSTYHRIKKNADSILGLVTHRTKNATYNRKIDDELKQFERPDYRNRTNYRNWTDPRRANSESVRKFWEVCM